MPAFPPIPEHDDTGETGPFACEQYALCENDAAYLVPHPVLGAVPTCERCAERVEALS